MSQLGNKFTREDREHRSYREKPDGSNEVVQAVEIIQEDGDAVKVDIGSRGISKNIYNQINSTPVNIETLIASYVVALGKKFDLSSASCSGDNKARFIIKVNGSVIQAKRTWWADFNVNFNMMELILNETDKVEIFVENRGVTTETFEATIIGGEYDAWFRTNEKRVRIE